MALTKINNNTLSAVTTLPSAELPKNTGKKDIC